MNKRTVVRLFFKEDNMASSQNDICNKALDLLGQRADIGNIDTPTTENERICARWYNDTLDFLLRRYVWNFAVTRKVVPRDLRGTPEFEYESAYKLPDDFVRLLEVNGRSITNDKCVDLAGGYILMNGTASSIELKYIRRETDVRKYDSGFKQLFSLYLAVNMAYRFTNKQTVLDRLQKWIELEEAKVISIDGQERPPVRIQRSRYRRARRGFGDYSYAYRTRPAEWAKDEEDNNASG